MLAKHARLHARFFFRLAYGVLRDVAAAEDACQGAMLKALSQRPRDTEPAVVKGWMSRIVVTESLAIARRRRLERQTFASPAEYGDLDSMTEVGAGGAVGRIPGEDEELRAAVVAALERLPERTRLIVVLCDMHAVTGVAVAEMLGATSSDVSRRLREGRRQLRELMADFPDATEAGS